MSFLTVVPTGFHAAISTICALPEPVVFQITYDSLDALFDKAAAPRADAYAELLADASVSADKVQSAINAITHVFRSAASAKAVAVNESLEADTSLPPNLVTLLADAWTSLTQEGVLVRKAQKNRAGPSASAGARTLQVGKLVSLDWRLGLGVASGACSELAAPFITLQFQVADSFGTVSNKTMELSIAQFQQVSKNFQDIAARLDMV